MFGDAIPADRLLVHRWRDDVETIGEIAAAEVDELAGLPIGLPLPFTVNRALAGGAYDLVVSVGQIVPHEVAGFGGYTKHVCIGLGGRETIQRSHFVGAICGIEETLGRVDAPVRVLLDRGFDRFLEPRCRVLFVLTVVESRAGGNVLRGVFAGEGGTGAAGGAAFRAAAELSSAVNIETVAEPFRRCVAFLNAGRVPLHLARQQGDLPDEARDGRRRRALRDRAGRDAVRRGRPRRPADPPPRLPRPGGGARRHARRRRARREPRRGRASRHGSTEGRFDVTYCPGPELDRGDVEGVGFRYLALDEALERFPLGPGEERRDRSDGEPFVFVPNPGLGLWRAAR